MLDIIILRNEAYEHLVKYLSIETESEVKELVRSIVDKIDDENILRNLTYLKYALDPLLPYSEEVILQYSDFNLCIMLLIIKSTKNSKYRRLTPIEIIDEFCKDYIHKINLDTVALYLINNFHLFYIDILCNEKDFLFNNSKKITK